MERRIVPQMLQHVSVPRPHGSGDAARRFYGELLGLQEIPVPSTIAHLDLIWYRLGNSELHLFSSDTVPGGLMAHFCIQVEDLDATRRLLTEHGHEVADDAPIHNRPRFFCRDPFGNRIEFTTILGPYQ